jgi:hypothetical protein
MSKKIKSLEKKGIRFGVSHLIEIFPSPLPSSTEDQEITCEADLFRASGSEGFDELYLNDSDIVMGESEGKEYQFSLNDFVQWQLERINAITIYHLINKTSAAVIDILDGDIEYEKDPDYYPEGWLSVYQSEEYLDKGLAYIERLKQEVPDEFYKALVNAILDEDFGLLNANYYESEIDENIDEVRNAYSHWDVPLMVVSIGKFMPYIEKGLTHGLMMDDYRLQRMYVRNYDEGDKA